MYIPTDLKTALSEFQDLWDTNPSFAGFLKNEFSEFEQREKRDKESDRAEKMRGHAPARRSERRHTHQSTHSK